MKEIASALLMSVLPVQAQAVELHYAPIENLERIELQRLNAARKTIDLAAFVLTDAPIIGALTAAAYRGVKIRVYLDGQQGSSEAMAPTGPLGLLFGAPNVAVKSKNAKAPAMGMKTYCIDGRLFRSGSANFTAASLTKQDSDLLLFDDPKMCSDFTINFDQLWESADTE
jgi:phosphatidylserine/phosphatidylglycerophosphate/cardiolipin synthase-like enzyme